MVPIAAQGQPLDLPADVRPSGKSTKGPKVFICYRRVDSEYPAQFIHDKLVSYFGDDAVFFDVDSIPLGEDFHGILNEAVGKCDVLLAVIGDQWLSLRDAIGQRRLDDPDDFDGCPYGCFACIVHGDLRGPSKGGDCDLVVALCCKGGGLRITKEEVYEAIRDLEEARIIVFDPGYRVSVYYKDSVKEQLALWLEKNQQITDLLRSSANRLG